MAIQHRAGRLAAAAACAALSAVLLTGCETLAYYTQAVGGQLSLTTSARALDTVIEDPATPDALRAKLRLAHEIREFATRELGLPDDGSYRQYAELGRPFVVWNLFVAPEFSTKAVESCFPVTGCVSYRGYFKEADALAYAARKRAEGFDVQVSGIPAYSTLGWFDDPLLSSFIRYPEAELARLIFHELAHHVVYAKGDTAFNESFAVAVERVGVRRWLANRKTSDDLKAFLAGRERQREFIELVGAAKVRLDKVYDTNLPTEKLREAKRAEFGQLKADYEALKARWGGFAGYDRIMGAQPGNALLASIAAYSKYVPGFERMLEAEGGDLPRFYAAVKGLARLKKEERCRKLMDGLPGAKPSSEECSPRK
jgi:predicted aminopeptidase